MNVQFDWAILAEKGGIGLICLAVIYFGFQGLKLVVDQWKLSTEAQKQGNEAVNKNTEAFQRLSDVFERQSERELEYQERTYKLLKDGVATAEDTNRKVNEIHQKIV